MGETIFLQIRDNISLSTVHFFQKKKKNSIFSTLVAHKCIQIKINLILHNTWTFLVKYSLFVSLFTWERDRDILTREILNTSFFTSVMYLPFFKIIIYAFFATKMQVFRFHLNFKSQRIFLANYNKKHWQFVCFVIFYFSLILWKPLGESKNRFLRHHIDLKCDKKRFLIIF